MADYKNSEGTVYKERDLRVWARKRGMDFDEYIKEAGLTFDKMDYDDAGFADKIISIGAGLGKDILGKLEGFADIKDAAMFAALTDDDNMTSEAKQVAMAAMKKANGFGSDPFEKMIQALDEKTLEYDDASITETFKSGDYIEGGFRAAEAGIASLPSILMAAAGVPGLAALAVTTAGSKFEEEFEEDASKDVTSLLVNAAGSGVIEAGFEFATRGLLKRSGLIAAGGAQQSIKLAKDILQGGATSIVKNILGGVASEGASEAATELTSTLWDQVSLGKKIDWERKYYEIADAGIVGGLVGGVTGGIGEINKKSQKSKNLAYSILAGADTKAEVASLQEKLAKLITDQKGTRKKAEGEQDGEFEKLQDMIMDVRADIVGAKERAIQGLSEMDQQEFDRYFNNVKKARPLNKIVKDKKKSKEAQSQAQKELDAINEENKAIVEEANNRKLEKNLKAAETRARQRGGEIRVYETQEDYIEAVSGVSKKKVKNKDGELDYTDEFKKAAREHRYSDGKIMNGISYINKQTARKLGSVSVGSHEVLHSIMDKYIRNEDGTTSDKGIELIDDMLSDMSKGDRAVLEKRINDNYRYNKDGTEKSKNEYYDEYLNVLHDAIIKKQITYNKNFDAVGGRFSGIFQKMGYGAIDLSSGKGLFNLIRTYTKAIETGESTADLDAIIDESKGFAIKNKKANRKSVNLGSENDGVPLNEKIDPLTNNAKTKEEFQAGGIRGAFAKVYQGIIDGSFDRLFGSVSEQQKEIQRERLADRLINYDPAKSPSLFAWMQGNKRKGKQGNVEFAAKDAKKELAKPKNKSLDATKKSKDGDIKQDVEDVGQDPEQQLIAKEKREQQEKIIKAKQKKFEASLGISTDLQNKIKDVVAKVFGGKLPPVTSPKYRQALKKEFVNEIGKKIEEIFGVEANYDNFIDNFFEDVIFPNLSNARLIQIERLLPKGEKIFVSKRRITKVKEVRKLQEQGLIDKKVKPASGPNLVQKMKLNMNKVKDFFNPPEINPKTGKKSGLRGTRKRALADAIAEEIAFNQVQEVLNSEDVLNKVEQLNELFEYDKVDNYKAEVIRQIERGGRNSNSMENFIKVQDVSPEALMKLLSEKAIVLENSDNELYNILKNDAEKKYGGEQEYIDNEGFVSRVKEGISNPKVQEFLKNKGYKIDPKVKGVKNYNEEMAADHVNNYNIPLLGFMPAWMGQRDLRMQKNKKGKYMFLHRAAKMDSDRGAFGGLLALRKSNIGRWKRALANKMGLGKMSKATKKLWAEFEKIQGDLELMESTMTEPGSVLRRVKEVQAMGYNPDGSIVTAKQKAAILRKEFNPKALAAAQALFKAYNSSIQDWVNTQVSSGKMTREQAIEYVIRDKQMNTNFNKGERALAALTSVYLVDGPQKVSGQKGEHMVDSATVSAATVVSIYNNTFLQDADNILKGFEQALLPKELADVLDDLGGRNSPLGNYRFLMDPTIGKNVYDLASGRNMYDLMIEQHGKDLANAVKNVHDFSRASNSLGKIYKAEQFRLDPNSPKKGISVFDFDETAGISDNYVIATKNGITKRIESADWPLVGDSMVKDGWKMDFSDFNKVTNGRPGPLMQKLKNQIKKYGNKNVFILTARAKESAPAIQAYLKSEGVDLPIENITGLGNSTGEAKADFMVDKLAEGYNDFYFVDDAMPNVEAVDNLLSQFDVKSKVVQAIQKNSESLGGQVDAMIEVNEGVDRNVVVDDATARVKGSRKGKGIGGRFFNTPGSNDFMGLMYTIANAVGKLGEAQIAFFEQNLYAPYKRGIDRINRLKQGVSTNYKALLKSMPDATKLLKKIVPGTSFTYDTAIRVYLFNKAGYNIPGMSPENVQKLIEAVEANNDLIVLASGINAIVGRPDGKYLEPGNNWLAETILSDLDAMTNDVGRKQHIQEFIQNREQIFGKWKNGKLDGPLMRKLESLYGTDYVEALNDMLWRMENGNSRPSGSNKQVNKWMNWLTNSIGAIMFFNTRSALLQTLSATNFINWGDNNPIKAAAALANFPQFLKDFVTIFNSDFLKQRRGGLKLDVNEAALAKAVNEGGKNKVKAIINYLLKIGFLPTQMADSFAIASGGATFYRNRINTYLKQGMSKAEAEAKAFQDMTDASEPVQQSSDPSLISKEQASILGRIILAFQNVTMQYTRRMKKSVIDLAKGRGDFKTNISRIVYYGAVQNFIFNSLQSALFALAFDEEEEDKKLTRKTRVANGMVDSILRGMGIPGAVFATGKNAIIEWAKQNKKGWNSNQTYTLLQLFNISPPIGSKARKIYSSMQTEKFNKKIIPEMSMWDISNPRYQSIGNVLEGIFNIPMGRAINKLNNIKQALDSDHATWQRIAMMLGWNTWDVGVKDSEILKIKGDVKKNKENPYSNPYSKKTKTKTKSKKKTYNPY